MDSSGGGDDTKQALYGGLGRDLQWPILKRRRGNFRIAKS